MKGFAIIIAGRLVFDNVTLLAKMETPKYVDYIDIFSYKGTHLIIQ